jgi:hypothetical protein
MGENFRMPVSFAPSSERRNDLLDSLRSSILKIEKHALRKGPAITRDEAQGRSGGAGFPPRARWELGCNADQALLPGGLEANALHEIKGKSSSPNGASAADWMAAIGFAVRLAVRRTMTLCEAAQDKGAAPWVLWCSSRPVASELGVPSAAGLAGLGLDPARLLIVETARVSEALNAIEESLRSQSLALVIGAVEEADLTPARRLSLAAGEGGTPCLLVTHPASAPAAAAATRWRIGWAPSALHPFDSRAPGAPRFSIALERARACPESAAKPAMLVEWNDETHRFDLAAGVADLPAEAGRARRSAFPAIRSY